MIPDLLIPATAALLDDWIGPVERASGRTGMLITWDGRLKKEVIPGRWVLDLSRAECRDRVARVLGADGPEDDAGNNGRGYPYNIRLLPRTDYGPGHFTPARIWMGRWFIAENAGKEWGRLVPSLAALDPRDDTRLPDGSRRVDALALAAVAREALS